jgi:hypothetical protein
MATMKQISTLSFCQSVLALALLLFPAAVHAANFTVTARNLQGNVRNDVAITVTAVGRAAGTGPQGQPVEQVVQLPADADKVIENGVYQFTFGANVLSVSLTFSGIGIQTTTLERVFNNVERTIDIIVPDAAQVPGYPPPGPHPESPEFCPCVIECIPCGPSPRAEKPRSPLHFWRR